MLITDQFLKKICKFIEPSAAQKKAASRSHKSLRQKLNTGNIAGCYINSFLIGSYARKTAIAPIEDVDVIIVIDPGCWNVPFLEDYPDPDEVIKTFFRAIKYRYPNSGARRQNRSVGLMLSRLNVDVVPAIQTNKEFKLLIPDRAAQTWIETAPKYHNDIINNVNRISNGLFIPVVKLLKFWNTNLPKKSQLKSFSIETIAAKLFAEHQFDSLFEGIVLFFDFISYVSSGLFHDSSIYEWKSNLGIHLGMIDAKALDTTDVRSNTLAGTSWDQRKNFANKAIQSRDWLLLCEDCSTDKHIKRQIEKTFKVTLN